MEKNILHDEHGEPTGLMYIAIFVVLIIFGSIWTISESGWGKFLKDIILSIINYS